MAPGPVSRVLEVPGSGNFRDLGGYAMAGGRVRRRTLMRADALSELTAAGRERLVELGVRTVVDLREPIERELDPDRTAGLGIVKVERPLFEDRVDVMTVRGLRGLYRELIEVCGDRIATAIGAVAQSGALPGVIHCSAGKDRTGVVCALLLAAIGVGTEDIAADYALTAETLVGPIRERVRHRALAAGMTEQAVAVAMDSPAELMLETLEFVERAHGGAATYLEAAGIGAERLESLRLALLDPYPAGG
jgi:protein-tyrosine phosphatase